ncbi:SufBD protein [Staphylothermus marinus F1]|uniref:SufBD protein n=1 Tax=Staphylothermus marinus (strain ATCC 43588 / DSM 3639 / JCM 9404 / F1) TaxID=399550 RepID=A3DL51_STAMF|nr:SufD family Fe-S cluster assembly protein [Staphylothermus marinus]ABN69361.1 SufBD protein [Staphylothermus marinus F1]
MNTDLKEYVEKANLPDPHLTVAGIINDKVLKGYYYNYLRRNGIILIDLNTALSNNTYKEEIHDIAYELGFDKELLYKATTGFYIKVPDEIRSSIPIYACFIIGSRGFTQRIINVVNIGDNAEAFIAKGCATIVPEGAHSAITLLRIGKNSRLTSLMIHNWAPYVNVGAKTIGIVGENSIYSYYYVKLSPVRALGLSTSIKVYRNAQVDVHEATYVHRNTNVNSSIEIELNGEGAGGLITTRGVVEENGSMNTRLMIKSNANKTRGHIECNGLVLGKGIYRTIPVLETKVDDTYLTHEASIGKISGEQLFYLQSRGLSEEEATKMIILGFLASSMHGLPESMRKYVEVALKQLSHYGKGL